MGKFIPQGQRDCMVKNYLAGKSKSETAALFNCGIRAVTYALKQAGVAIRDDRASKNPELFAGIVREYQSGIGAPQLAQKYAIDDSTIYYYLDKMGIERHRCVKQHSNRKHSLNQRFFAKIDSPEKAYWLGYLTADGGINRGQIAVNVARRDKTHLSLLAKELDSSYVPSDCISGKGTPCSRLLINSIAMVRDLAALGVGEQKSFDASVWRGPETLMIHYWRGIFDGDGGIWFSSEKKWRCCLVGSEETVNGFADFGRILTGSSAKVSKHSSIWKIAFGGKPCRRIIQALYEGAPIAMERKRLTFEEINAL